MHTNQIWNVIKSRGKEIHSEDACMQGINHVTINWGPSVYVCVCFHLLDWDVVRGLPMYFRIGFLFLSSPSFSFLIPLSCGEWEI